ncbi:MAG: tRNA (guanosine(46)-N7)-methyltransferase TrmB [Draconibacterium sp.]
MGKNKLAKFAEMRGFENVIEAPYRQLQNEDFYLKGNWAARVFDNQNPVILELGCGKGEYTVQLGEKYPETNFIGVDIKGARLYTGAKQALEKELKNVAFLRTNIEAIERFFASGEVTEIWLTFPDPQMKKTSRRLTSSLFLERYRRILIPGGTIHLKTDSNFQFTYTSELAHLNEFEILAETRDLYESEYLNDLLQIKTFYEKQWLDRGIKIKYIAFKLHNEDIKEPQTEIEHDEYRSFGRSARDL